MRQLSEYINESLGRINVDVCDLDDTLQEDISAHTTTPPSIEEEEWERFRMTYDGRTRRYMDMKDLKTHLLEAIKPPRLSAKNRELWTNNKPLDEEEVMEWLAEYTMLIGTTSQFDVDRDVNFDGGKINIFNSGISIDFNVKELPYPFGTVDGSFFFPLSTKTIKNIPQSVTGTFFVPRGNPNIKEADVRKVCDIKGRFERY